MLPKPILLSREHIPDHVWNDHICHSRQCVIYALSWYLDTVCEQWEALVWPSLNELSIAMPLPVKYKFGRSVLYQPLFCQYLGVFSKHELQADEYEALIDALKTRFAYISDYAFNPDNLGIAGDVLRRKGLVYEVFQTHWLNLDRPYREIYQGYSKDRRTNLKRSTCTAWEVVHSDDLGPLLALFAKNHAPSIGNIPASTYVTLKRLVAKCIENTAGLLMYARRDADVHAGILLTHYRGRTIYLFNAADAAGRNGNARAAMLDAYFRANAGRESVFDFESPAKKSIAGYYVGFGAVAVPFCRIKRNALPFPFRQIQRLRKWLLVRTS